MEKALDGTNTRMLRKAFNVQWSSHITNEELYKDLTQVSNTIAARRAQLAGHCHRHPELSAQPLVLWEPKLGQRGRTTYIDTLKRDTGIRDTVELDMLMRNRDIWRMRVVGYLMATK